MGFSGTALSVREIWGWDWSLAAISHTDRFCVERWVLAGTKCRLTAWNRLRDGFGEGTEGPLADRGRISNIAPPSRLPADVEKGCWAEAADFSSAARRMPECRFASTDKSN